MDHLISATCFPFQVLLSSLSESIDMGDVIVSFGGIVFELDENQQPLTVKSRVVFVPQCVVDKEKTVILMHHE